MSDSQETKEEGNELDAPRIFKKSYRGVTIGCGIGWLLFHVGMTITGLIPALYQLNARLSSLLEFVNVGLLALMFVGILGYAVGNFWEYVLLEVPGTKISVMLIQLFFFQYLILFDLSMLSRIIIGGFMFLSNQLPSDKLFSLFFYSILSVLALIVILGTSRKIIVDSSKIKDTFINDYRKFKQEKPRPKLIWMVLLLIVPLDFIALILLLFPLVILRQLLV